MDVKTYEEVFGEKLTIAKLVEGFSEDTKTGKVEAFAGKLNIRPPYQREFVYELDKQKAVIDTITKNYPLNVMYWAKNGDMYEMMDGQQRTLSICKYFKDAFSYEVEIAGKKSPRTFSGLLAADKEKFLNYPLTVYICDGDEEEKLNWFRTINIAGVRLTKQEMNNAIYNGKWVTDAKRYFSRVDGEGYNSEGHVYNGHKYGDYLSVESGAKSEKENSIVRQKLLEIVLSWATDAYNLKYGRKIKLEEYMALHHNDNDARELWRYYEDVMEWVREVFPTYRSDMKGVEWGLLYNRYSANTPEKADERANDLFDNYIDEISNRKGVYEAVLSGNIKHINARAFDKKDKEWAYKKQNGVCPYCHKKFAFEQMHGDHIKPWSKGGITERNNLQMLCIECNSKKSGYDTGFNPWDGKDYNPFDITKWDK